MPPGNPGTVVVFDAFDDAGGREWSSTAAFEADSDGKVDTSKQAPVQGYYRCNEPRCYATGGT
jgi:Acyl-CoA thioester hydrolase/BAAT N-terminal region